MKHYRSVLIIGIIEILIGGITLSANFITLIFGVNTKTLNVFMFVLITSVVSTLIGIGLLKFNRLAFQLLLYFSSVILLSKILIYFDVIQLNGALETTIPSGMKRLVSLLYHGFLVYYLTRPGIRKIYHT